MLCGGKIFGPILLTQRAHRYKKTWVRVTPQELLVKRECLAETQSEVKGSDGVTAVCYSGASSQQ